jgi:hypothetical protein
MKNSNDTVGNRTHNLPVCRVTLLQSVHETHLLGGGVVHFEASHSEPHKDNRNNIMKILVGGDKEKTVG